MADAPTTGRGGAVVTGAARGLGLEIARRLAGRGYAVTIADIDNAAAHASAGEIGAEAAALDVRDAAACEAIAHHVAARDGALEVWVNNAGILRCAQSWAHSEEERRAMF